MISTVQDVELLEELEEIQSAEKSCGLSFSNKSPDKYNAIILTDNNRKNW